ncbi:DUF5644 domain-containing protein [Helicobacter baculiformis]|uniref:DUF5644 domain-containing protein n=1 Tax=Helicobacter baculiformis TaxID=427351 RepID=A0ABV7ZI04_9HELI|nr:DUF5644 domain-containing protein [Helicobacter baculiformis]
MSVLKLQIKVFRFDARKDYNPSYQLAQVEYALDWHLSDVLAHIPLQDFSYDRMHLGVRLNQVAVFEDARVLDLIAQFGKEWVLEPLSLKYARHDLCMDEEAILKDYQRFLHSAPFLTQEERHELARYTNINFVQPSYYEGYYGDGFFLYVKWLMGRYPHRSKDLLQSIADSKYGVMNFVSPKPYLYPPSDRIEQEIYDLQKWLIQASNCPIANNVWAHIGKNLESKYQLKTPQTSQVQGDFLLFNGYEKTYNSAPLLQSAKALLARLNLRVLEAECCFDGGYWGRLGDLEKFLSANAYNMALAQKMGVPLLLCDQDAYANALYAQELLTEETLREKVNQHLAPYHLEYQQASLVYLNAYLLENIPTLSSVFSGFSSVLFACEDCNYHALFQSLGLACHTPLFAKQSITHLLDTNAPLALERFGALRYEAIDLGVDFLLTTSVSQFHMLDTMAKRASKAYSRDHDNTSVLYLPQLILLGMGEDNAQVLGLHGHQQPFNFL